MLKLLLIESSPTDRVKFVDRIQNEDSLDAVVDCADTISEAFAYLERAENHPYDQIWLNPGLSDLKPNAVGQVLVALKKHVEVGELRLLTATTSPELARQAKQHEISVLHKTEALSRDDSAGILEMLQALEKKRSGGTTERVELGKHEIRLLNLEGAIDELKSFWKEFTERMRQYEEVALQVKLITDLVNQLPSLKESINKLERLVDKDVQSSAHRAEVHKSVLQYVLPALLSATTALGVLWFGQVNKPSTPLPTPIPTTTVKPIK